MRQIDNSTSTTTKPTPPAAGTAGFFQDTDTGGGTVVPAWFLNSLQDEIVNAIVDAGLTPDKTDDTQLSEAISILGGNQGYLHVRDEKASGTSGGTFASGAWQTRTLNTSVANTITGASLASNQITLPAGTYRIKARAPSYENINGNKAKLYNVTDNSDVIIGGNCYGRSDASVDAFVVGEFTIATSKTFELRHRCVNGQSTNGFGRACSFGVVEVYAEVEIFKTA